MKRLNKIMTYARRSVRPLSILLTGVLLASCIRDKEPTPRPTDEAAVMLTISTPQPSRPTPATRSLQTFAESRISTVRVLLFKKSIDGSWSFFDHTAGTSVESAEGHPTRFRAIFRSHTGAVKLMILTNSAADAFLAAPPAIGTSESEVRTAIRMAFPEGGITGDLPMYGETELSGGINPSSTANITITALRAVARVDVMKELKAESAPFELDEVYIFRANNTLQAIPNAITSAALPKVAAPSIPAGASFLSSRMEKKSPGASEISQIYVPECATVAPANWVLGTTTIVVGGRFNGSSVVTYYRVDFDLKKPGHPFGQILRNHRYLFKIVGVSSAGLPTPEEAANSMPIAMTVNILDWEDFDNELYIIGARFGLSSRKIMLPYLINRGGRIDIDSAVPYTIEWLDASGRSASEATSLFDRTVSNARFDVRKVKDTGDGPNVSHLSFRTLRDNYGELKRIDTLLITASEWRIKVAVGQDITSDYSKRSINILSTNQWGNLGDAVPTSGDGEAMRMMLDKQFSSLGRIKIEGFNYSRGSTDVYFIAATPSYPKYLGSAKQVIARQDVIFLAPFVAPSEEIVSEIESWLAADTRRVLIVSADDGASNPKMWDRINPNGSWKIDQNTVTSGYYKRAIDGNGTAPFFSGPFGNVSTADRVLKRGDDVCRYYLPYRATNQPVCPLIVGDKPGGSEAIFLGVNLSKRIVFLGDTHFFSNSANVLSNKEGNVDNNSDMDKLICNLWAWITAQAIYGDDLYQSDFN